MLMRAHQTTTTVTGVTTVRSGLPSSRADCTNVCSTLSLVTARPRTLTQTRLQASPIATARLICARCHSTRRRRRR